MFKTPRKTALVAAVLMGMGPFAIVPASAADWYQPGDPTQHEIERGDTRVASSWYQPGDPTQHEIERAGTRFDGGEQDIYGTD